MELWRRGLLLLLLVVVGTLGRASPQEEVPGYVLVYREEPAAGPLDHLDTLQGPAAPPAPGPRWARPAPPQRRLGLNLPSVHSALTPKNFTVAGQEVEDGCICLLE
jgi:hypothetical protein